MADAHMPATLGAEDYRQLYSMATSPDAGVRAQASELSRKLTPDEQNQYFTFQKTQHPQGEMGRVDNSIGGLPPEMAVLGGLGVARGVASAGAGMVNKTVGGLKAAAAQAAPALKYEATKSALQAVHVPPTLAIPIALAVSGYKSGKGSIAGAEHVPTAEGYEQFGPSSSASATAGPLEGGAANIQGPSQATYTQLADGSWGLKGSGLRAGEAVHVMNRAGNGQMVTVGNVLGDGTATIAGQGSIAGSAPKIALSGADVLKVRRLIEQGIPQQTAVDTVLTLTRGATGSIASAGR